MIGTAELVVGEGTTRDEVYEFPHSQEMINA
jgi:hypothetical protein